MGRKPISQALTTRPDVVVLDYSLPVLNGIEATRQIRARVPGAEVLIFTMHDSSNLVREVLEAGAKGFLLKSDARKFLIAAVESLAAHQPFFTGKVSETLLETYLAKGDADAADIPRKVDRTADRRRSDQQEDRRHPQHQPEDRRDASRLRDAQAQPRHDGRPDPIRGPKRARRGLIASRASQAWQSSRRDPVRQLGHELVKDHPDRGEGRSKYLT